MYEMDPYSPGPFSPSSNGSQVPAGRVERRDLRLGRIHQDAAPPVNGNIRENRDSIQSGSVEPADSHDGVERDNAFGAGYFAGHLYRFLGAKGCRGRVTNQGEGKETGSSHEATRRIRAGLRQPRLQRATQDLPVCVRVSSRHRNPEPELPSVQRTVLPPAE